MENRKTNARPRKRLIIAAVAAVSLVFVIIVAYKSFNLARNTLNTSSSFVPPDYGGEGSDTSLLVISQGKHYGYINLDKKVVIKPQFDEAHPFYDGLAVVKLNGKYGYIDNTGNIVIPCQYISAEPFQSGKAIVGTDITKKENSFDLTNTLVIDKRGNVLHEFGYIYYTVHQDGLFIVNGDGSNESVAVYDEDFNEQKQYPKARLSFNEGIAGFMKEDGYSYFLNKAGEYLFPYGYYSSRLFSEGLAAVQPKADDYWGYIDTSGKMVIPPQYTEAIDFHDGVAWVHDNEDDFIINKSGEKLSKFQGFGYPSGSFSEGLCVAYTVVERYPLHPLYGYVDLSGKWAIEPKYSGWMTPFKNGIAEVLVEGKIAYIDKTGKYIWGPK